MDKSALRTQLLAQRRQLTRDEVSRFSDLISLNLQKAIAWQQVRTLHMYRSQAMWNEVSTAWLEAFVYTMWPHIRVTIGSTDRDGAIPDEMYDLIIVPLVAYDSRLNRLGLGSGWYDRFLSSQPDAIAVGLAYGFQHVSQLTVEQHDVPLTMVVTESGVTTR